MKKLKLTPSNSDGAEILSRAQLKNVLGGTDGGDPGTTTSGGDPTTYSTSVYGASTIESRTTTYPILPPKTDNDADNDDFYQSDADVAV